MILEQIKRTDPRILSDMAIHYSQPKGFVGRNICYAIIHNGIYYGSIVGGSSTLHLPGRNEYFNIDKTKLNSIINNIFYHVEKRENIYPYRNFTVSVLTSFLDQVSKDWERKYSDKVLGFESLVELPRTGEMYKRCGFDLVGQTIGYTCKRTSGKGTDNWSGKRIWDTKNLKP
jgi:hypothetical protein